MASCVSKHMTLLRKVGHLVIYSPFTLFFLDVRLPEGQVFHGVKSPSDCWVSVAPDTKITVDSNFCELSTLW